MKIDALKVKVSDAKCASGQVFEAKLARNVDERAKGLSRRKEPLRSDEGMLFVMDAPEMSSFWMKETLIPLSIGFFDKKGKLINSLEMSVEANPDTPEKYYNATGLTLTALEVPPGAFDGKKPRSTVLCVEKR